MGSYRKDDLVVCDFTFSHIWNVTIGNVYKVLSEEGGYIWLVGDDGIIGIYNSIQFKNIQEARNCLIDEILK